METLKIRKTVREGYASIVKGENSCCDVTSSCCGGSKDISKSLGYSDEELKIIPEDANLGLGCGNPIMHAELNAGDTVLDLGSGAGMDCFLAAQKVGDSGKVIGVDMTPDMIEKAREIAETNNAGNVDFRLGEIEHLPVADSTVDCIISNCVINLSPEKEQVFKETFRVVKPGGKLVVSDIVLTKQLPESILKSSAAYIGCISGAVQKDEYLEMIRDAGFENVEILETVSFPIKLMVNDPTVKAIIKDSNIDEKEIENFAGAVESVKVRAFRKL